MAQATPVGVLLIAPSLDGFGSATVTIGLVLAEATILYAGYGVVARITSPAVRERLGST